jgi:hypothetical protein
MGKGMSFTFSDDGNWTEVQRCIAATAGLGCGILWEMILLAFLFWGPLLSASSSWCGQFANRSSVASSKTTQFVFGSS